MFNRMVKRVAIDVSEFLSLIMALLLYYYKINSFLRAAMILKVVKGQIISYTAFAILLILLPILLLSCFRRLNKGSLLRCIFYGFAACIFAGTVSDMITYKCFIGYTYMEGDPIFVNLMWNMPNIIGILLSFVICALYIALGKQIKRKRRISFMLYLAIFVLSHIPPIIFAFATTGTWPRDTYLQKSLYVLCIQLLILVAFSVASTSRSLWKSHIWN